MSSRRKSTPSYLPHKQSGRDRAVWTDALGVRQQKLLPGPFDSPASRTAFAKLQLELVTAPLPGCRTDPTTISVVEVLLAHLDHAERHYRRSDGTPAVFYSVSSYGQAIHRACEKAFPPPALLARREDETEAGWSARLTDEQ